LTAVTEPGALGSRRLIVASAGGAAKNPAWYYNLKAHPDRVWIQIGREKKAVTAEQLHGAEYDAAWQRIAAEAPQFAGYRTKTDRLIPVIRLS
jgi:deazaflavin-dependent oxidoreductase (nitroreductase family)